MKRRQFLMALAGAAAWLTSGTPLQAQDLGALDGAWEGTMTVVHDEPATATGDSVRMRLQFDGDQTRVFINRSGAPFREVKPGQFRTTRVGPSAVITAVDTGVDNEGTWVESWSFSVTLLSADTLMTRFTRIVNNVNLPSDSDHGKFAYVSVGTLHRIAQ